MGIMRIFSPTKGKAVLFIILILFSFAIPFRFPPLDFITLLQFFFLLPCLPALLILPESVAVQCSALFIELVYLYFLACVYVEGFVWIESSLRKKFPGINRGGKNRRSHRV
jgi:hypothetical protein